MANGPPRRIADVQVGEKIKSRNPATGQDEAKTVIATVKRIVPAVVTVTLTDAKTGQTEALTCTPEHPFFVTGQGWVEAGSLGIGTSIVSRAGPALSVTNVTWKRDKSKELASGSSGSTQGGYTVYNLTVEDDHTYFVGTTGGGTWVHNTCTIIGQVKDTASYVGKDGYNVLNIPKNWSWQKNLAWLNKAVKNGDTFKLVTDPAEIQAAYRAQTGGKWTLWELDKLNKLGATIISGW